MHLSSVLLALVMALAAAVAVTGSQAVYAEGEEPEPPAPAVNVITAAKAAKDNSKYNITITNAQMNGKSAGKVQVRTWSQTKGKGDLVNYNAKKTGGANWRATVDSTKHCYQGT